MINLQEAEQIHQQLIDKFGGSSGIRDLAGLQSALNRPFQTFDNQQLYPSIESKGNKRTGYVLMRMLLLNNQIDIKASQDQKYDFVIKLLQDNFRLIKSFNGFKSILKK